MSDNRNAPPTPPPAYQAPLPQAPGYQPPGYGYQAPVGTYQAPAGAYQAPIGGYPHAPIAAPRPKGSPALGLIALALALIAAVACTIIIGATGWTIGHRLPGLAVDPSMQDFRSLAILSPVRDLLLWAELSLWIGTATGIAAIVLGIIAIVKRHGRGSGIAALVLAGLGPIVYVTVGMTAFTMGATAGALATVV